MAVTNVTQDEQPDSAGNLVEVYDITFTIPGKDGTFTVTIPRAGDPVAAAQQAIADLTSQVDGIYAL